MGVTVFLFLWPFYIVTYLYGVHLPNDTLLIAFENTLFSLNPKENATVL
jgi:hypothetical protein